MITTLINNLIEIGMIIIGHIVNLILLPIQVLIMNIFPDISNWIDSSVIWLRDNLFHGIAFFREAFLNITGIERAFWSMLIGLLFARITYKYATQSIRFIKNIYSMYKGAGGKMVE